MKAKKAKGEKTGKSAIPLKDIPPKGNPMGGINPNSNQTTINRAVPP